MSKHLLSEGLFGKILSLLTNNSFNKAIEQLKKDPELNDAIKDYQDSSDALRIKLKAYESRKNG